MENSKLWTSAKFFERLELFLSERGWSLYQLCSEADITSDALYKLKHRKALPSLQTACTICDALDLSLSQFFVSDNLSPDCSVIVSSFERVSAESLSALADIVRCLK